MNTTARTLALTAGIALAAGALGVLGAGTAAASPVVGPTDVVACPAPQVHGFAPVAPELPIRPPRPVLPP
ncbi:MAG TPA: hypothetical protein VGD67_06440, partial [Pseudonocardiaceae bacterium]